MLPPSPTAAAGAAPTGGVPGAAASTGTDVADGPAAVTNAAVGAAGDVAADAHAAGAVGQLRLAVLGMHRSGTSYVAGTLQNAGLALGAVSTWNPHNQRGNREHDAVVQLNDEVLADNGGAWDDPPEQVVWRPEHLARARAIAAEHADRAAWGFKDPRTLLTVSGWRAAVPGLAFVGTFRHPDAVTGSLQARARYGGTRMSRADCLALWAHYNSRLLALYDDQRFPVVCYDWALPRLEAALDDVARGLGLSPAGHRFLDPELRHESAGDTAVLPQPVRHIHRRLCDIAEAPPS